MHNKAFKSDSQRLAISLRSSIANRRSHLNAPLAGKLKEQFCSGYVVRALHLKFHVFQLSRQWHFQLNG
ncbi:hypothetical protein C1N32_21710 [Vibrio diazotrophicus]|uniref:Uncharacterized protein n=1 Tax=Vibrio diazotrophicus TaxID=685 RepID=A0A2J8HT96_VIBDI|nr:hypothetical protein C1N32_21710 [Vibrio diazotrophicus]PNI01504.1 hypothetical protein C1O25_08225 [Vibrio diazotrophicus]